MATDIWRNDEIQRAKAAELAARNHSLEDLQDLLLAYLEVKNSSDITRMNYRSRLKLILQFIKETEIDLLHPEFDLGEQFLYSLAALDFKTETIRAYATVLRSLYEALAWAKVVRFDPFFMIDISKFLAEYESLDKSKDHRV